MNLKDMMDIVPPAVKGELNQDAYRHTWYPIYTHFVQPKENGGYRHGYAKCLVAYSPDFCGGMEVRSALVQVGNYTPKHCTDWGWDRMLCGRNLDNGSATLKEAAPWLEHVWHLPKDDELDLYQVGRLSLASYILTELGMYTKAGLFGKDRDGGEVQQLVQLVSELSKVSGFVSKHCYYGSSLREYEHEHRQYRRFSETSFFNCNSENTVVACQSIMDESVAEEASYDDGYFGTISHRAVEGGDPVGELLTKFAPTEEWCCG